MQPDRKTYIGGSDAAAVLGVSPWKTPLDCYIDKTGSQPEDVDPAKQKIFTRGKRMEPYVMDILAEETGLKITSRNQRYTHPEYSYIAAEIDGEAASGENIEIKTVNAFSAREWGDHHTDDIPIHYTAQAMHGLMVTGRQTCIFGVLIGSDDFRTYQVQRDDDLISVMLEKEKAFWDMVTFRQPPPLTSSADVLKYFGDSAATTTEASSSIIMSINRLRELKANKKQIETELEVCEEEIKLFMENNDTITINHIPVVTWKTQTSNRLDQTALKNACPDIYNRFLKSSKSRVLRLK